MEESQHLELVLQDLARAALLSRLRRFMGNSRFRSFTKVVSPDEPPCFPSTGPSESPSNTGFRAVIDSISDVFDLAELPDEKSGGCSTRATGGLSRQCMSLPRLHPDLTRKSFPCRLQRLAKTILLSAVDLITLFYFVVTC